MYHPAITNNDCLVAISGSGETKTVTIAAETSKDVGAKVVAITTNPNPPWVNTWMCW